MKTKIHTIRKINIDLHPEVANVCCDDIIPSLIHQPDLAVLPEKQLLILLTQTVLHVIKGKTNNSFLLLQPNPIFEHLQHHPLCARQNINLVIHQPTDDRNLHQLLYDLLVLSPCLHRHLSLKIIKNVYARHKKFKQKPVNRMSLRQLANLAAITPSALRSPQKEH